MLANIGKRSYYEEKNRYWTGVLYPENMIDDWRGKIDRIIERPYCYIVHDKDSLTGKELEDHERKEHVHLWVVWGGPTTGKNAVKLFDRLSKENSCCMRAGHEIQSVQNTSNFFKYLIHSDDKSVKAGKHRYDENERITGNNFDIGAYIVLSDVEIKQIRAEIITFTLSEKITNFADLMIKVRENYDDTYEDVLCKYQAMFTSLTRGNYLKYFGKEDKNVEMMIDKIISKRMGNITT